MKKIFTLSLVMMSFFAAKAQTGSVLVGGNVSIESNSDDQTNLEFSPFVGYQFNKNWTAGLALSVASQKIDDFGSTVKVSALTVGPFLRYTQPLSDIFSVFGQLEAQYATAKSKADGTTIGEANGFGLNLYPAVFVNVKNGFGLNFDFGGLTYVTLKPDGGSAVNNFRFNFGKTVNIGISKNFGKRK